MRRFLIYTMLFVSLSLGAREVIKDYALFCTQERVNGQIFSHRTEIVRGEKTESWKVNEQELSVDSYHEALVQAEAAERRIELKREAEALGQRERDAQRARGAILKKLLARTVELCRKDLIILEQFHLEPFFTFSSNTLEKTDYERIVTKLMPRAKEICGGDDETIPEDLELVHKALTEYESRIHGFVFASIQSAITQCDDPKLLKELLALV